MRLHLGCGHIRLPGYINADIDKWDSVDLVCDARQLPFEDNTVDFMYTCALIEEFGRYEWIEVLKHWYAKLKKGATLRLSTSDFGAVCEQYMEQRHLGRLLGLVVGGQREEHTHHGMVFDYRLLKQGLEEAGFMGVHRYDWRMTDVGRMGIDDYSQAYIPHMDKKHGRLMSLNVEAQKWM